MMLHLDFFITVSAFVLLMATELSHNLFPSPFKFSIAHKQTPKAPDENKSVIPAEIKTRRQKSKLSPTAFSGNATSVHTQLNWQSQQ